MSYTRLLTRLAAVGLFVLIGCAVWVYISINHKQEHNYADEYITIEPGTSSIGIIRNLTNYGVIASSLPVRIYVRLFEAERKLEAGDYKFTSPISPLEVLKQLEKGRVRAQTLTIPEGWTRFEIAERIASRLYDDGKITKEDMIQAMDNTRAIEHIDSTAENLEGYLYPDTYRVSVRDPPEAILRRMVQEFEKVWRPDWDKIARERGFTTRDIVTIASLIESETRVDAEKPIVASVIYNRINREIPLGIDASNVYIAKMLGKWDGIIHRSDVTIDHPYNTRKVYGLPPGPICSPSESALEAALHPADTDYLYYVLNVTDNDGSHHFYSNANEFIEGKKRYQRWLKSQ